MAKAKNAKSDKASKTESKEFKVPTDPVYIVPAGFGFATAEVAVKGGQRYDELTYEFKDKFLALIRSKIEEVTKEMQKTMPNIRLVEVDFAPSYSGDYMTGLEKTPRPVCKPVVEKAPKAEKPATPATVELAKTANKTVEELSNLTPKTKKAIKMQLTASNKMPKKQKELQTA